MRGDHTFEMQSEHKRDLITVMFPSFFTRGMLVRILSRIKFMLALCHFNFGDCLLTVSITLRSGVTLKWFCSSLLFFSAPRNYETAIVGE